jgi:ADP-ribose pyrophosphatase
LPNDRDAEVVYRWEGPPTIELTRQDVAPSSGLPFVQHALTVQGGQAGAVIVATRGESILFVRHFRPAINATVVELPRGFADRDDANALATGVREFGEELGLSLELTSLIGEYVLDTSIYPSRVGVVTGELVVNEKPGASDGEVTDWMLLSFEDVHEHIRQGLIGDGHTLSALAVFFATRGS